MSLQKISSDNQGGLQPLASSSDIKALEALDQKIQKKTKGILYNLFGIGRSEVKQLRIDRFTMVENLVTKGSLDTESLKKIHLVMKAEVERLGYRNLSDQTIVAKHNLLQGDIRSQIKLGPVLNEIMINDKPVRITSFRQYNREPNFVFSLQTRQGALELKGAGLDSKGNLAAAGSFGRVYSGVRDGTKVAVKVIEILKDKSAEEEIENEIRLLRELVGSNYVISSDEAVRIKVGRKEVPC